MVDGSYHFCLLEDGKLLVHQETELRYWKEKTQSYIWQAHLLAEKEENMSFVLAVGCFVRILEPVWGEIVGLEKWSQKTQTEVASAGS